MRVRSRLARWIGGTSVVVLDVDESAVVIRDDRSPSALYLTDDGHDGNLTPGASLVAAVFIAAASEPGRLVTALDRLESVRAILQHGGS